MSLQHPDPADRVFHDDVGSRIVQQAADGGGVHFERRFRLRVFAGDAVQRGAAPPARKHVHVLLHFQDRRVRGEGLLVTDPESSAVENSFQGFHW